MSNLTDANRSETVDGVNADDEHVVDPALRIRYRIRFGKTDLLRWISHRDLARLWERLVRRADFKLSMSEGFHPKPRIAFPSALALGVESYDEVVEIELAELLTPQELLERLQKDQQPGLTIKSVCQLPEGFGKAQLLRSNYTISMVEGIDAKDVMAAIASLLSKSSVTITRKNKSLMVEVAQQITKLEVGEHQMMLSLAASDGASLRPGDVLDLLGFGDWIERGALIRRTHVVLKREMRENDPNLVANSSTWESEITAHSSRHEA